MTKDIMEALGIRNWATATRILRKLEAARLVTVEEQNVGRYKSKAKFWRIEDSGAKVATALEEAQRLSEQATSPDKFPIAGRPGIVDIQSQGEKLVVMVQNVVKIASGKA
jgi:DNA-binding PadR family transcriptional regulator